MPIKKLLKIKSLLLVTIAIVTIFGIQTSFAQEDPGVNSPSGSGQEVICRGKRDWSTVGISIWNEFMDPRDWAEYFQDITVRYFDNACYYNDIYSLIKQEEKISKQIKDAFSVCASTDRLKERYYSLEAEIYFLRHYVNIKKMNTAASMLTSLNVSNDFYIPKYPDDGKDGSKSGWESFTSNIYKTKQERDSAYELFRSQYLNRVEAYKNCDTVNLESTYKRIVGDFETMGDMVKKSGKRLAAQTNKMAKTAVSLWDSIKSGELISNMVELRLNNKPCPILSIAIDSMQKDANKSEEEKEKESNEKKECMMGLEEIADAYVRNAPGYLVPSSGTQASQNTISFSALQEAANELYYKSQIITKETDSMARYEMLYYNGSDTSVQKITAKLDKLNKIITDTYNYQNQTINCVTDVSAKQCINIPAVVKASN